MVLTRFLIPIVAASLWLAGGIVQGLGDETTVVPPKQSWHFSGPFGVYDKAQLQRGLQVYHEVCSSCHGLNFVAFRDLEALGYPNYDIKIFARNYQIQDGQDETGMPLTRPATLSDYFPSPLSNAQQTDLISHDGIPVDLSLMAKARGPDYLYALLTGYEPAPEGTEIPDGHYYNRYFASDTPIKMAPPLDEGIVTYQDGHAQTIDAYARDVSAFLMWTADPHREKRHKTGLRVLLFLLFFSFLIYLIKRRIWLQL